MTGHAHHEPRGDALLDAARVTLEGAGEQWTDMRKTVFVALAGFANPASAYDIADAVSKARGKRVAANSVYRILDIFVDKNLAHRVESANAYIANAHPDCVHDCIFLVCDLCSDTVHIDDDPVSRAIRSVAAATGFRPSRPVIEVRGTCAACAGSSV
ncbi:Fur family transcriptional regulator [Sphingomonas sp.]|jgi:Fur family zinc uptake transcriptional regulator|uniref:Fur family transcriptional regulator n=1 Tax=Sphingomonas sp. TaxID=28214 RepID=UPI002EDB0C56